MRFAHLSDTHLGYRQFNLDEREEDFYNAFQEAVESMVEEKVDFVIHSGDLFDEPRPHMKSLLKVREALEKLESEDIPVISIAGNHDLLMRRGAVPPQRVFSSLTLLTPGDPYYEVGDLLIAGLPYFSKIHRGAIKDMLEKFSRKAEGYKKSILLLHQGIDKYFGLEYELKIEDLPPNFDYYALGHIHKRIVDQLPWGGKLAYPGSTEIWRSDEVEEYRNRGKGFFVVEAGDFKVEERDLVGIRPFLDFQVGEKTEIEKILNKVEEYKKKPVVKIETNNEDFSTMYRKINSELRENVLYLDIKRRLNRNSENEEIKAEKVDLSTLISENFEGDSEEKDFCMKIYDIITKSGPEAGISAAEDFFKQWRAQDDNWSS